ncbi:MAG: glutaminyl-peptide cyclotransferase [Theionarchaea archaeon]|nr:glutaminyl-peptide cyclotransferase [Theionarchaea archaeon]
MAGILCTGCLQQEPEQESGWFTYQVVSVYPHDPGAFTQGLVYNGAFLYEGTGLTGRSSLRKVDLESGSVLKIRELEPNLFGEGITLYGDRIVQITWQSQRGFMYDKDSFELLEEFTYPTEGWGLTFDGQYLVMSDGTAVLHFLDPETYQEVKNIEVHDGSGPVTALNELEFVKGRIYANVWLTDTILIIDPETGEVEGWIDLQGLLSSQGFTQQADVLNGIAYDAEGDRLFVTGKLWPYLFEIKLVRKGAKET